MHGSFDGLQCRLPHGPAERAGWFHHSVPELAEVTRGVAGVDELDLRPGVGGCIGDRRAGQAPGPLFAVGAKFLAAVDEGVQGLPAVRGIVAKAGHLVHHDQVQALPGIQELDGLVILEAVVVDDVDVEVVGQQLVALLAVAVQHGKGQLGEVAENLVTPGPLQCGQGADNQHALDQTQLLEVVKGPQDTDRFPRPHTI